MLSTHRSLLYSHWKHNLSYISFACFDSRGPQNKCTATHRHFIRRRSWPTLKNKFPLMKYTQRHIIVRLEGKRIDELTVHTAPKTLRLARNAIRAMTRHRNLGGAGSEWPRKLRRLESARTANAMASDSARPIAFRDVVCPYALYLFVSCFSCVGVLLQPHASCKRLRRAVTMATLTTRQWGGAVLQDATQRNAVDGTVWTSLDT